MYVYIYIFIYIHLGREVYVYTRTYTYMYNHIYISIYIYIGTLARQIVFDPARAQAPAAQLAAGVVPSSPPVEDPCRPPVLPWRAASEVAAPGCWVDPGYEVELRRRCVWVASCLGTPTPQQVVAAWGQPR